MTCKDCKHSEQRDFSTYQINYGIKTYCMYAKFVCGSNDNEAEKRECFEGREE